MKTVCILQICFLTYSPSLIKNHALRIISHKNKTTDPGTVKNSVLFESRYQKAVKDPKSVTRLGVQEEK